MVIAIFFYANQIMIVESSSVEGCRSISETQWVDEIHRFTLCNSITTAISQAIDCSVKNTLQGKKCIDSN